MSLKLFSAACLVKAALQSFSIVYALCDTFIDFPQSANGGIRHLTGQMRQQISYSGIDEILVSHLTETEKMPKSQCD
jgi:hypothetical protein